MTIFTDGLRLEPERRGLHEFDTSLGARLGAEAGETFQELPTHQAFNISELADASGFDLGRAIEGVQQGRDPYDAAQAAARPDQVPIAEARAKVKDSGLDSVLHLPAQETIAKPALDIMLDRARARQERAATIARGPQGFVPGALSVGTSFLVGALDPLNVGAAFIPVVGEARYAKLLADAGESAAQRAVVRGGVGAASGAVGTAPLIGLEALAHTQEGRDYTMAEALHSLVFNAGLGGALHAGAGAVGDILARRRGIPAVGTHVPAALLREEGIGPEALREHFAVSEAGDPNRVLAAEVSGLEARRAELNRAANEAQDLGDNAKRDRLFDEADQVEGQRRAAQARLDAADTARTGHPVVAGIADLPPRAHEDTLRGSIASIIDGRPVRAGEMIEAAAQQDPRIAQAIEAWHGSVARDIEALRSSDRGPFGPAVYLSGKEAVAQRYVGPDGELLRVRASGEILPGTGAVPADLMDRVLAQVSEPAAAEVRGLVDRVGPLDGYALHRELTRVLAKEAGISDRATAQGLTNDALKRAGFVGIEANVDGHEVAVFDPSNVAIIRDNGGPVGQGEIIPPLRSETSVTIGGQTRRFVNGRPVDPDAAAAAWRDLAQDRPPYNEPEVVEASMAAAKAPEPASLAAEPSARVAAAEKAAAEADEIYKANEPFLPEDLKAKVDEQIKLLDAEGADRAEVIQRGAACLAAATGAMA